MFVEKVQSALNQQINMELQAHYTYLAAADYLREWASKVFRNGSSTMRKKKWPTQ